MPPVTTNQSSARPGGDSATVEIDVEIEFTEEEERLNEEILLHPTRDDVHEQRERGQNARESFMHIATR